MDQRAALALHQHIQRLRPSVHPSVPAKLKSFCLSLFLIESGCGLFTFCPPGLPPLSLTYTLLPPPPTPRQEKEKSVFFVHSTL